MPGQAVCRFGWMKPQRRKINNLCLQNLPQSNATTQVNDRHVAWSLYNRLHVNMCIYIYNWTYLCTLCVCIYICTKNMYLNIYLFLYQSLSPSLSLPMLSISISFSIILYLSISFSIATSIYSLSVPLPPVGLGIAFRELHPALPQDHSGLGELNCWLCGNELAEVRYE